MRIAFDPFHVVKLANEAVRQVRRGEARERKGSSQAAVLKDYSLSLRCTSSGEALHCLLAWASRSRLAPFVKLAGTLRKYRQGVPASIDSACRTGGWRASITRSAIKHRAYGFHSAGRADRNGLPMLFRHSRPLAHMHRLTHMRLRRTKTNVRSRVAGSGRRGQEAPRPHSRPPR